MNLKVCVVITSPTTKKNNSKSVDFKKSTQEFIWHIKNICLTLKEVVKEQRNKKDMTLKTNSKMTDVNTIVSIIKLNENMLNTPIKRETLAE